MEYRTTDDLLEKIADLSREIKEIKCRYEDLRFEHAKACMLVPVAFMAPILYQAIF